MEIIKVQLPEMIEALNEYPSITKAEIDERYSKIINKMDELNLTHLVVYGDREHYTNIAYLTGGYDSRFEESLLIIQKNEMPVLILGNEGLDYSNISLLEHEKELFQTFSPQGQTRDNLRSLNEIFKNHGINSKSRVGIIGLKYFEADEADAPSHVFDIPHYIIQEASSVTPFDHLINATHIMSHQEEGLRSRINHHEIARFECMNNYLSNQMKRIIENLTVEMSEVEAFENFNYKGIPFNVHPVVLFGTERVRLGLASPSYNRNLQRGDMVSIGFGVEGANIARTGYAVSSKDEYPNTKKEIIDEFYFPYFTAIKGWYEAITLYGNSKSVYENVIKIISNTKIKVTLNPGHQIHMEEWLNSPFRNDYDFCMKSGMVFQCDIIAFIEDPYDSVHIEDTLAIADNDLRERLKSEYPESWKRIRIRQEMMKNILGINIKEEVLPLSNIQAVLHPFLLEPGYIITSN